MCVCVGIGCRCYYLTRDFSISRALLRVSLDPPHYNARPLCSFDNDSLGNDGVNCAAFVKTLMVEKDITEGKAVA